LLGKFLHLQHLVGRFPVTMAYKAEGIEAMGKAWAFREKVVGQGAAVRRVLEIWHLHNNHEKFEDPRDRKS
jgi:hypothetical protein